MNPKFDAAILLTLAGTLVILLGIALLVPDLRTDAMKLVSDIILVFATLARGLNPKDTQ